MLEKLIKKIYSKSGEQKDPVRAEDHESVHEPIEHQWVDVVFDNLKIKSHEKVGYREKLYERLKNESPENRQQILERLKEFYIFSMEDSTKHFKKQDNLEMFKIFNEFVFENDGIIGWMDFAFAFEEMAKLKKLSSDYLELKAGLLIGKLEKDPCINELRGPFIKNELYEVVFIIENIEDALRIGKTKTKEEFEKFLENTISLLDYCSRESENYMVRTLAENSKKIFQDAQSHGIADCHNDGVLSSSILNAKAAKRMEFNSAYFFEKYDIGKQYYLANEIALTEEDKNNKHDGLLGKFKHDQLLYIFLNKELRMGFKNDLGIDFDILDNPRQRYKSYLYVTEFLKRVRVDEIDYYKKFFSEGGRDEKINRLKTFFSLETFKDDGDKIINIGNKESGSPVVFKKICEIIDITEKEVSDLSYAFIQKEKSVDVAGIRLELLRKSHEIIKKFSDELSGEQVDQEKIDTLLNDLDRSKTEIIFLASAIHSFKSRGEKIDLEMVRELDFSVKDFGHEFDFNEEEMVKQEMLYNAERNYRGDPLKNAALSGLKSGLNDPENNKFYILRFQGKVVSFLRFQKTGGDELYWGSFNTDTEVLGLGMGNELMNRALSFENERHVLIAAVSPRILVGTNYVEKNNHVIDGYVKNYHESGEPLFMIRANKKKNPAYQYRNEGKEIKISEEEIKRQVWTNENLDHIIGSETIVLGFDVKNDFEKMKTAMKRLLVAKDDNGNNVAGEPMENKYVVTRYFRDKNETEKDVRYFVFEKI
ncbi:MAG: hypothetical protein PHW24_02985 [Candidatus Moranbacteria bacterium]|nr:hypothetical protein [Candidatus Moranbacteria bacterium]